MEVFISQLVVCPPWRLPPMPGLAREPPAVGGVGGRGRTGLSSSPLHPDMVEEEEASCPGRRSNGMLAAHGAIKGRKGPTVRLQQRVDPCPGHLAPELQEPQMRKLRQKEIKRLAEDHMPGR